MLAGLALITAPATAQAEGTIVYVDKDAPGNSTGVSWTNAFTNLQDALDQANVTPAIVYEIWVAEGVYYPDVDRNGGHVNNAITETFRVIHNNVRLYGGFGGYGAGETQRSERNWVARPTVLSGDTDGNDRNADANHIAETWTDIVGANAYHVLILDGILNQDVTPSTTVDGFTITAGFAGGEVGYAEGSGGGLYCRGTLSDQCNPTLAHLTFSGNAAASGGGMHTTGSRPRLMDVTFVGNKAESSGGGMHLDMSSPRLTNVIFINNQAGNGGGMANNGDFSNAILSHVIFISNSAGFSGGGMAIASSQPSLTDVEFIGNWATYGGGISFSNSLSPLINVVFRGNAARNGGGIYTSWGNPTLTNVVFSGNSATLFGGGAYNWYSGLWMINTTFSGNWAAFGGGMCNNYGTTALLNGIVWGNAATTGPQIYDDGITSKISHSNVEWTGGAYPGLGNINVDPRFVAPVTATAAPTTTGNYRLLSPSPAIDAGSNLSVTVATDLDGRPRRVDILSVIDTGVGVAPIVDMGAYETPRNTFLPRLVRGG